MAKFVDVYLLPIPERNVEAYRELAANGGRLFRKHGARVYREFLAADLKVFDEITSFTSVIKLEEGETLVYAAVEFDSREHRDETMQRIMDDPEMHAIMPKEPLFEMNRMVYGGFELLSET